MTVYVLHFERPVYGRCRHYIGFTTHLEQRLAMHASGHGARITAIARRKGIAWEVAHVWEGADKDFERALKRSGGAGRYCPICSPQAAPESPERPRLKPPRRRGANPTVAR